MDYKNYSLFQIDDFDVISSEKNIKEAKDSHVYAFGFSNFNSLFKEIFDSQNSFINLFNAIQKFHSILKGKRMPYYYQSFRDLKIDFLIVELLKQKQAPETQYYLIEIVRGLSYSSHQYIFNLIESGIIPVLIDLYHERIEFNEAIIDIFSNVVDKNIEFKNQIINSIDIKLIFSQLLHNSISDDQKTICMNFLSSILAFNDYTFDVFQLYLFYAKELLNQWRQSIKYSTNILIIINQYFCDFQKNPNFFEPFHKLIREVEFINLIFLILEENNEFIQKTQNLANDSSSQNRIDSDDNVKMSNFICTLLDFLAIIFEQRVDLSLNFQLFIQLANSKYEKVRITTMLFIGNMFESMPETIQSMMSFNFFELIKEYIANADNKTKQESIICSATAISFADHSIVLYFIENDFFPHLCDSVSYSENNLLYMILQALFRLIDSMCIQYGPTKTREIIEDNDCEDVFEIEIPISDTKSIEAMKKLYNTVQQIQQITSDDTR